jgi:hypothetical protein
MADAGLSQSFDDAAASVFQQRCGTYRTIVDNNCMFHREVYGQLHRILVDEVNRPFCFLDIACGDASASFNALKDTTVAAYHGIELFHAGLGVGAHRSRGARLSGNVPTSRFRRRLA